MVMRDQHVVDLFGQIGEAVALQTRTARITDHRIAQDAYMFRLDQDARVTEITNAHAWAFEFRARRWWLRREERFEYAGLIAADFERFDRMAQRLRRVLHLEQLGEARMSERQIERDAVAVVQARCAEHKRALILLRECQR